jgi:hypothetical protein
MILIEFFFKSFVIFYCDLSFFFLKIFSVLHKLLLKFKKLIALAEYSKHRQNYGVKPWLPKFNKQFTFGVLPG